MTEEEKLQVEEAGRVVEEVNRRLKPIEDAFMGYVSAYHVIGYGRMIQLIQEHWNSQLARRRTFIMNEGEGKCAVRDLP